MNKNLMTPLLVLIVSIFSGCIYTREEVNTSQNLLIEVYSHGALKKLWILPASTINFNKFVNFIDQLNMPQEIARWNTSYVTYTPMIQISNKEQIYNLVNTKLVYNNLKKEQQYSIELNPNEIEMINSILIDK